jgi:hypothetical protein
MNQSDREMLIDYMARERAETAICHVEDYRADLGWSSDDEDFWYHIFRKVGITQWDQKPFEQMTDQELLELFVYWYDVDPEQHLMDAWVTGEIFNRAFGADVALAA